MDSLLFTGGTGFLGRNVKPILDKEYKVTTIGITPMDELQANFARVVPELDKHYDIVLHAAGKAHVYPKTEEEKQAFYDINFNGTVNLCKALENVGVPRAFVFISTASVYGEEGGSGISEDAPLVGNSPYAESKRMAEEYLQDWATRNNVILGILRPSLLAGKDAPGNLGAMVKGIMKGYYFNIAGGNVQKSLLMAEDIAHILPLLIKKGGIYNVCDTHQPTYKELSISIAKQLGVRKPISIPYWFAYCLALVGNLLGRNAPINTARLKKLTTSITLSNEKARKELGWEPMDVLENYRVR